MMINHLKSVGRKIWGVERVYLGIAVLVAFLTQVLLFMLVHQVLAGF